MPDSPSNPPNFDSSQRKSGVGRTAEEHLVRIERVLKDAWPWPSGYDGALESLTALRGQIAELQNLADTRLAVYPPMLAARDEEITALRERFAALYEALEAYIKPEPGPMILSEAGMLARWERAKERTAATRAALAKARGESSVPTPENAGDESSGSIGLPKKEQDDHV